MARPTKSPPRAPVPAPAPPDPALRQRAWAALTLGLLSVVGLFFLGDPERWIYVLGLTLAFGIIAIWLGVLTGRLARRGAMVRPAGARSGVVFGTLGCVLSAVLLLFLAVLGQQIRTYASCMAGANTVATQQACKTQFTNSVNDEINRLEHDRLFCCQKASSSSAHGSM
jgi:hypothetical protein